MRLNRIPIFLALACGLALPACETLPGWEPHYHRVIETNVRGEWTVSWIAEGEVYHFSEGWRFRAVQRNAYNNPDLEIHYPLGRRVTVSAANVLVEPAAKPGWLQQLDAEADDSQDARRASRLRGSEQGR